MAYIPEIVDYKPFYIQTDADDAAINTTEWGMVAKSNPYPALPNPKEPYKNEWKDEDGDDEYTAEMCYEAFEFDVTFYVKVVDESADSLLVSQVRSFFDKIKQGEFKVYDAYTKIGRQKVRYAGYKEDSYKRGTDWARAIFTVTFKVNDPITRIIFQRGQLVESNG